MSGTHNTYSGGSPNILAQLGPVTGGVYLGGSEPRTVRIIPGTTSAFQNRQAELSDLDALLDGAERGRSRLWCLTGPPGTGKTALAITWINQHRDHFSHAQIAIACGGDLGEGHGRGIVEVCDRYFSLRGIDTDRPGFDTDEGKVEMFRAMIEEQDRPTVLLLDDVRTAAQVRPFLSNTPNLVVITTSRLPVKGVADSLPRIFGLRPLPDGDVSALFRDVLGDQGPERLDAEPEAFDRLVALCGGSPLLAGTAAALLHDRTDLGVGDLVARMEAQGRLTHLVDSVEDGPDPAAVFEVSYAELSSNARALYRALGLHPVRHVDRWLAGSLLRDAPDEAGNPGDHRDPWEQALDELCKRSLLKWDPGSGRYLMDDLTYEHARLAAQRHGTDSERHRFRARIREYHLYAAVAADTVRTARWRVGPLYGAEASFPLPTFTGPGEGETEFRAWLEHRRNPGNPDVHRDEDSPPTPDQWFEGAMETLLELARGGAPGDAWQLAEATNGYFTANGRNDLRALMLEAGFDDAVACGNADATARMRAQLAEAALGAGDLDKALEHARASLAAAETPGADTRGRGAALEWIGLHARRSGDAVEAERLLRESRPFLDHTRERPLALSDMHLGDVAAMRGDTAAALQWYRTSMERFRAHARLERPDRANEGKVLLAQARLVQAPAQSRTLLEEAREAFLAADRAHQLGKVLEGLGELLEGRERVRAWTDAAEAFQLVGRVAEAERVLARIG
ncbi:tetratricopeptide repeat protein [Nocardiopsis salina]|uniref:tetratricopeptide repeat protein n=1 Tax=Nocardiopsis salina TaxID=245836 RepID=UPI0013789D66|nr:tetratricopeptide repeat protein [Nocardiopsis salina]